MTFAGYDHLLAAAGRLQWDDAAIDLRPDAARWPHVEAERRRAIADLVAGFCLAETAVATQLAPFEAAADGALAACLAQQAVDEARHARFFGRVRAEVTGDGAVSPALRVLFEQELPARATAAADGLPAAMGFYHLILEGLVFAAGQTALLALTPDLPGVHAGVTRVQADERWHVGLGVQAVHDLGAPPENPEDALDLAERAWPGVAVDRAAHVRRLHIAARVSP